MLLPLLDDPATQTVQLPVALWAVGILLSFIGALMLIVLNRVLAQGDDTNKKVTSQGEKLATVISNVGSLDERVNSLHRWRNELQARELEQAQRELEEERRRRANAA